jgi:hypothetical protein
MPYSLNRVTIKGFKSIKSLENFELRNLNVLIGGNGAGKSNFIDFFRLLRAMMQLPLPEIANSSLDVFINTYGWSSGFLFKGHKGGDIRFDRAKVDISGFLKQRKDTYVSMMFDYFRIHNEWPGHTEIQREIENRSILPAEQKAKFLEDKMKNAINKLFPHYDSEKRFIPYIQMHEFEALLFSDGNALSEKAEIDISQVQAILDKYKNPEEINDDPEKAPSKQLESLNRSYRKVVFGKIISERIGIPNIRAKCPHFNNWLTRFENLPLLDVNE